MGAGAFQKQWQPKVNQDLNTKSGKVADDLYEVSLRLTITVTIEEETVYLIEVDQAGLFAIRGLEPNQLTQVINTTCPSLLFPYAREAIDNILTKGSFPALMLPPINFDALFASAVKQAEEQQAQQQSSENSTH
jgi:preprotein translocase subunit SecB